MALDLVWQVPFVVDDSSCNNNEDINFGFTVFVLVDVFASSSFFPSWMKKWLKRKKTSNTSWNVKKLDIYHLRNGSWLCFALKIKFKKRSPIYIYLRKKKTIKRGINNHCWTPSFTPFGSSSPTSSFVYVLLPLSLRELSLRSLWSSSANTAGSCFFLCFDMVLVVIDPIFSNATWNCVDQYYELWILNVYKLGFRTRAGLAYR